jgi:hypothetical protein
MNSPRWPAEFIIGTGLAMAAVEKKRSDIIRYQVNNVGVDF